MKHFKATILVVDRDLDAVHDISAILQKAQYTVRSAQTGAHALAMLRSEPPDLVLLLLGGNNCLISKMQCSPIGRSSVWI